MVTDDRVLPFGRAMGNGQESSKHPSEAVLLQANQYPHADALHHSPHRSCSHHQQQRTKCMKSIFRILAEIQWMTLSFLVWRNTGDLLPLKLRQAAARRGSTLEVVS